MQMFQLCIAAAVVAVTTAAGGANGGVSISRREEDSHGNYKFDYDVNDAHGNTQNRWETTDAHNVRKGGYSFTEPDGRFRQVQYEADGHGFRVLVRTNEPGTITHFPDHAAVIHEVPPVQGKQVSAAGLAPAPGHGVGLVQPPPLALKGQLAGPPLHAPVAKYRVPVVHQVPVVKPYAPQPAFVQQVPLAHPGGSLHGPLGVAGPVHGGGPVLQPVPFVQQVPVTKYPSVQQIPVPHHTHVYHHVPVSNGLSPVAHKVPVTQLHEAPATVHQLPLVHRLPPPKLVAPLIVHQVPRAKVPVHVFPYGPAVHHAPISGYTAAAPSPVFLQKIPVAKFAAPAVPYVPIPKFSVPLTHPGHVAKPLGPGLVYSVPAPREALAPAFVQRPLVFKHAVPFLPSVKLTVPHLKAVPVQHFVPIGKVQRPVVFKKAPGRSRVPSYTPESVKQSAPSFDDDVESSPINLGRGFQQKAPVRLFTPVFKKPLVYKQPKLLDASTVYPAHFGSDFGGLSYPIHHFHTSPLVKLAVIKTAPQTFVLPTFKGRYDGFQEQGLLGPFSGATGLFGGKRVVTNRRPLAYTPAKSEGFIPGAQNGHAHGRGQQGFSQQQQYSPGFQDQQYSNGGSQLQGYGERDRGGGGGGGEGGGGYGEEGFDGNGGFQGQEFGSEGGPEQGYGNGEGQKQGYGNGGDQSQGYSNKGQKQSYGNGGPQEQVYGTGGDQERGYGTGGFQGGGYGNEKFNAQGYGGGYQNQGYGNGAGQNHGYNQEGEAVQGYGGPNFQQHGFANGKGQLSGKEGGFQGGLQGESYGNGGGREESFGNGDGPGNGYANGGYGGGQQYQTYSSGGSSVQGYGNGGFKAGNGEQAYRNGGGGQDFGFGGAQGYVNRKGQWYVNEGFSHGGSKGQRGDYGNGRLLEQGLGRENGQQGKYAAGLQDRDFIYGGFKPLDSNGQSQGYFNGGKGRGLSNGKIKFLDYEKGQGQGDFGNGAKVQGYRSGDVHSSGLSLGSLSLDNNGGYFMEQAGFDGTGQLYGNGKLGGQVLDLGSLYGQGYSGLMLQGHGLSLNGFQGQGIGHLKYFQQGTMLPLATGGFFPHLLAGSNNKFELSDGQQVLLAGLHGGNAAAFPKQGTSVTFPLASVGLKAPVLNVSPQKLPDAGVVYARPQKKAGRASSYGSPASYGGGSNIEQSPEKGFSSGGSVGGPHGGGFEGGTEDTGGGEEGYEADGGPSYSSSKKRSGYKRGKASSSYDIPSELPSPSAYKGDVDDGETLVATDAGGSPVGGGHQGSRHRKKGGGGGYY